MDQLSEFIRKFKEQYADGDQFEMQPSDAFRQVGSWDSLTEMAVLVMIQDEFGIVIPSEKFRELITLEEVFNYTINSNNGK